MEEPPRKGLMTHTPVGKDTEYIAVLLAQPVLLCHVISSSPFIVVSFTETPSDMIESPKALL
jgi:hypothetical protein